MKEVSLCCRAAEIKSHSRFGITSRAEFGSGIRVEASGFRIHVSGFGASDVIVNLNSQATTHPRAAIRWRTFDGTVA